MKGRKKVKKAIALIMTAAITAGITAGCRGREANEDGKVSISVGYWPSQETAPQTYEAYERYKEEMKKKYPNIEIIPSNFKYSTDTFMPMAASGQLPTLYRVPYTEPKKLIENGYAKDITEAAKQHGMEAAISDNIRNIVSKDGRIYGIPYNGYIMGIGCNAALMRQAGLTDENGILKAPETYDELAEMAKTVKDKTGQSGFTMLTSGTSGGWVFMNLAWSYGVNFMEKQDGKWRATFNTPAAAEAMRYISDLKWKYDVLPPNVLVDQMNGAKFLGVGQTAMGFLAEDWADDLADTYKMNIDDIAYLPLPAGPDGRYGQMGGGIWMISDKATDEQVDACMKWLELKGEGPQLTEEAKANLEKKLSAANSEGDPVYKPSFRIWKNEERIKAEDEIYEKYINVEPHMFRDLTEGVKPREEEPVCAQQLYTVLSSVMQEILTNKDADIKALLDEANANFQRDFLDKAQ